METIYLAGPDGDATYCKERKLIEDFSLSHNLMFAHTLVADDPRSCLLHIKKAFR
jgi:hypothetical protein